MVPGSFAALTARAFEELDRNQSIFGLPARKFVLGTPGRRGLLGPSAGPHTQMAQNLLLSWLAGSRVVELKTVQILDRLRIPRPCIDARTVGFNVEWSQELTIDQSAVEYVKGSMLIDMLAKWLGVRRDCTFDLSVGYDLEGIRSAPMRAFMQRMIDARPLVDSLRSQIPHKWRELRDLDFTTSITPSVTLSTFHGCRVGEIEQIADFLMSEMGLDCTVKLNPTLLGSAAVREILNDRLGYTEIEVPSSAFENDPQWDEAVTIVSRLLARAGELGRRFSVKLTNTLVVENVSGFLPRSEQLAYLSGSPLHVLAMHLVQRFRRAFGPALPISFSAGIDRYNYPDAVRLGLAPITVCTDLLKQGGYGRLPAYAQELRRRMDAEGVKTVADFIDVGATDAYVEALDHDPRYRKDFARPPRKSGRRVTAYDCALCDLCMTVCPNAAVFAVPATNGHKHSIAIFDDWCNDCGNCETFCPDLGAPNRTKPRGTTDAHSWPDELRAAILDPARVNSINCLSLEDR